ncbi:MAG: hypothetical protein AVDCRST_MAG89-419, partial [uncultured Gemmatimonadetes bacterium]
CRHASAVSRSSPCSPPAAPPPRLTPSRSR